MVSPTGTVMERLGQERDDWIAHDDTYVVDGDDVGVLARYNATNKATGKPTNVHVAHHVIVRGAASCASNSSSTPPKRSAIC